MYFLLIITFLLFLVIIITGIQNSMPLEVKFIFWDIRMSITALIFYSSLIGGAIVAILALPRMVKKSIQLRGLKREINRLTENMALLSKEQTDKINKEQIHQEI